MSFAERLPEHLRPLAWATATWVGGVLLHIDRLPPWVTVATGLAIAWRFSLALRGAALPPGWLRALLMVVLVVGVLVDYRTLNGLTAGSALLAAMGAVKILETRSRRDDWILIGAALFLLLAACLDRQGLLRAPLYVAVAWLASAALAVVATPGRFGTPWTALHTAGRALLLATPLALALFLFFPRVPGAFWAVPGGSSAVTGLTDEMSPGSIDALTENDVPALRVEFLGEIPPPAERYWRGPVLHDFDGATWRRASRFQGSVPVEFLGPAYRHRVTLEPSGRPWWFALDLVTAAPDDRARVTFDGQILAAQPVDQPVTYEATSHTRTRALTPLTRLGRRYDTALPGTRNPRARVLAAELRARTPDDRAFAQAALDVFRNGGFEYTLTPPKLDADAVDEFLFRTKRGFCGHYASAYATLMRAGGVPARVVTGYQGGEWNPIGRYLLIRQSDAHAWVEVWFDGQGWTRVDPTAVVAPERLSRGLLDLLPAAGSFTTRITRDVEWLGRAALRWDAVNTWWRRQVVGFDFDDQLALLDDAGFEAPEWRHLAAILAASLVAWLAWVAARARRDLAPRRPAPLGRAYGRLCANLARTGLARDLAEPPLAYAARIATSRPDLADSAGRLVLRYAALRFGAAPTPAEVRAYARAVRALRIR
jgi:transglutaminase-like putative cysteine protease